MARQRPMQKGPGSDSLRVQIDAAKDAHHNTAWAIRIGDRYFAGFTDRRKLPPSASDVKLTTGLCDAKLIGGSAPQRRDDYIRRLAERGHEAQYILVTVVEGQ